jgi:hypothetical protein
LKDPKAGATTDSSQTHPAAEISGGPPNEPPPRDTRDYELVIDNDSGTYRPNGDLLPKLKAFLESNFTGLKIVVMPCDSDELQDMKKAQRELKKKEGNNKKFVQIDAGDSASMSSQESDLEDREREGQGGVKGLLGKAGNPEHAVMGWLEGKGGSSGEKGEKIQEKESPKKEREERHEEADQVLKEKPNGTEAHAQGTEEKAVEV